MRRAAAGAAAAALLAAAHGAELVARSTTPAARDAPSFAPSPWRLGRATFYGERPGDAGVDAGACGFGPLSALPGGAPYGWDGVAAVSDAFSDLHDGGHACGRCYQLRCIGARLPVDGHTVPRCAGCCKPLHAAPITVRVVDSCPADYPPNAASNRRWCSSPDVAHFDLAAAAFDRIASSRTLGYIALQWRRVACAPVGNVTVYVFSAVPGDKAELTFKDTAGAGGLRSVEVRAGEAPWEPLQRGWGATWQLPLPPPPPPLSFRLAADDGQQLLLRHVIRSAAALAPKAMLPTGAQFSMPKTVATAATFSTLAAAAADAAMAAELAAPGALFTPCVGAVADTLDAAAAAAADAASFALGGIIGATAAPQAAPTAAAAAQAAPMQQAPPAPPDATMLPWPLESAAASSEQPAPAASEDSSATVNANASGIAADASIWQPKPADGTTAGDAAQMCAMGADCGGQSAPQASAASSSSDAGDDGESPQDAAPQMPPPSPPPLWCHLAAALPAALRPCGCVQPPATCGSR